MSSIRPNCPRIGAVSYLNTLPLVYGMLHGPQQSECNVQFFLPADCAASVEAGSLDIGLVPVAEMARQGLEMVPGTGIAAQGPVRSILLFSKVPWNKIRAVAVDRGSRTSVELARVILRNQYGVSPTLTPSKPNLATMLQLSDAALIIGDPALRIDPAIQPFAHIDLATEWVRMTSLPFVFAVWAGRPGIPVAELQALTWASYQYGKRHIDAIVESEADKRGLSRELASDYLRRHLSFEINARELEGLEMFLKLAGLAGVTA